MTVKATREGRVGYFTYSGYKVEETVPFVALPCTATVGQWIQITNPNVIDPQTGAGRTMLAIVLDVGPWNIHDFEYVYGGARPQAESGTDVSGRETNRAGIDLGERVWRELGMTDNGEVEWSFLPRVGASARSWLEGIKYTP